MKILVAIDDSRFSDAVVQSLISLARPESSEALVLHVHELVVAVPSLGGAPETLPDYVTAHREAVAAAKRLIDGAVAKLAAAGWKVTSELAEGEPKVRIVERATEWKADLVVMGSHGRKGLQRFLMGSVSEAVSRHAPCSVLIVRASN